MIDVADINQTLWHAYPTRDFEFEFRILESFVSTGIRAECLLDVCDINHSGVEDYTPEYIQGISHEKSCAEVDKLKGINSNFNSEFYCSQNNY